jgi:hypothetical protein
VTSPRRAVRVAVPVLVVVVLMASMFLLRATRGSRMLSHLFDGGHALVFGAVAGAALVLSRELRPRQRARFHIGIAAVVSLGLGALVETIQYFGPRDADLGDLGRNALGTASVLIVAAAWGRRGLTRAALCLAGGVFMAAAFTPVFALAGARAHRSAEFPRLAMFDSVWEQPLQSSRGVEVARVAAPGGWAGHGADAVCRLRFHSGSYPGLAVNEVWPDWTGYAALVFEVYSEEAETRTLLLRVEDLEHDSLYPDRYNAVFQIPPGHTTIRIPLDDVQKAPRTRLMDLQAMSGLTFFADHPAGAPFTLYLDDVRLER